MLNKIPLRALLIEDMDDDAQILLRALKDGGYEPTYLRVEDQEGLADALQQPWQIVFSDFTMPTFNGMRALKMVRQRDPDLPFIFVSGTIGEEMAVEAVRSGAQDYILKGNLKRLSATVPRELRESEMRRERRRAAYRLHQLANYDELTSLPNRNLFVKRLNQLIERAGQTGRKLGIVLLNLDHFVKINSRHGRQSGDKVIKTVARRLARMFGKNDVVARMAGDEFALILPDIQTVSSLFEAIRKIQKAVASPISLSGYTLHVRASIGVGLFPFHGARADELQQNATLALYMAKQDGGGVCRVFSREIAQRQNERHELEQDLEHALETQSLTLVYQPQVDLAHGRVMTVEALIRWKHPERGFIAPSQFIPIAEESGLILPLGQWVWVEACRQLQDWKSSGLSKVPRIAVNFSAYQFNQRKLTDIVKHAIDHYQLSPEMLEVEITETALMQDPQSSLKVLASLRNLGVSISLDDFGTGYSSLSYLKRFPVDVLKIDKSFIDDVPTDANSVTIIRAIIALADRLGISVVAEGVETRDQVDFLKKEGCKLVQGYYFQRPIVAEEMTKLLLAPGEGLSSH